MAISRFKNASINQGLLKENNFWDQDPGIRTTNLVTWLDPNFTNFSGSTWLDKSGNNNNLSLLSGAAYDNENAVIFDGVDDFGNFNKTLIGGTNEIGLGDVSYSLEAWVNFSSFSGIGASTAGASIVGTDGANGVAISVVRNVANTAFTFNFGIRTTGNFDSNISLQTNTWYHVVGVRQAPNTYLAIYVNGVLSSTNTPTALTVLDPNPSQLMKVAIHPARMTGKVHGKIGVIRIYNSHLSATEVENHFARERIVFGV
jgi:hypothetical protein